MVKYMLSLDDKERVVSGFPINKGQYYSRHEIQGMMIPLFKPYES